METFFGYLFAKTIDCNGQSDLCMEHNLPRGKQQNNFIIILGLKALLITSTTSCHDVNEAA